jgi:hypothetical protein
MTILQDMSTLLGANDEIHVLAALLLLRRGVRHHKTMLITCLGEFVETVTTCLQSNNNNVVRAALVAADDLVCCFSDAILQHIYSSTRTERENFVIALLYIAATPKKYPKMLQNSADNILKHISTRLHQASVLYILEQIANITRLDTYMKNKVVSLQLLATYRLL